MYKNWAEINTVLRKKYLKHSSKKEKEKVLEANPIMVTERSLPFQS